jgi:hypothetical protein
MPRPSRRTRSAIGLCVGGQIPRRRAVARQGQELLVERAFSPSTANCWKLERARRILAVGRVRRAARTDRNSECDFHGERRRNDTHASTTDPMLVSFRSQRLDHRCRDEPRFRRFSARRVEPEKTPLGDRWPRSHHPSYGAPQPSANADTIPKSLRGSASPPMSPRSFTYSSMVRNGL